MLLDEPLQLADVEIRKDFPIGSLESGSPGLAGYLFHAIERRRIPQDVDFIELEALAS